MPIPVSAILWAQWRTLRHFRRGDNLAGLLVPLLALLAWYGVWTTLALLALVFASNPANKNILEFALPRGLMFVVVYWQLVPVMAASLGASLDLKKLLVYPVPHRQLFGVEVLLRLTTCAEMLLVLAGLAIGLLSNPALPERAGLLAFVPFVLFNLLLAAGLRNQIERWMARGRVRELLVLLLVLAAALPQLLVVTGVPVPLRRLFLASPGFYWPWSATTKLALGEFTAAGWTVLLAWTLGAYFFGRWQFERSLRFDAAAAESLDRPAGREGTWLDRIYRLPSLLLSDPLAAVVEKELRSLSRSPRFRLVFIMGFTFGVVVFLPFALRNAGKGEFRLPADYLVVVSAYALILLGDVAFWNVFGFDRAASQIYFLLPVPVSRVLVGKNLATIVFVVLEVAVITAVWSLLRMPVTPSKVLEAYAVTLILSLYVFGAGNMSSVYYPRAVTPQKLTGAGSRFRALLLLVYPVLSIPVLLAYGARYAFDSQVAFHSVLGFAAVLGVIFYWIALTSAAAKAEERKEKLLQVLTESEGPVALA
jgi:ABC-2 type transport system permease protein